MSDFDDYNDLKSLKNHPGYLKLQALWTRDAQEIMGSLDRVTKLSGKDQPLRYHAGRWNGFNVAIGHLDRALEDMERVVDNKESDFDLEETLKEIRGDKQ